MNLYVRLKELNAKQFNEIVSARYFQLRKNQLSTESLINRYLSYYHLIKDSGAAQREEDKWSRDSDIDGEELNFEHEINYIIDWFKRHTSYLDQRMSVNSTDIKITSNEREHYYNLNGQRINKDHLSKGLYIKDGRKYVRTK